MGEDKKLPRISLRDAMKHTALCGSVTVREGFTLQIRPWSSVQVDDLRPLIIKILEDFKSITDKKLSILEGIVSLLQEKWGEYKEMVLHAVYVTLERGNKTWYLDGEEYELFTEEEMAEELSISIIMDVVRFIWEQNFEKNLSRGSYQTREKIKGKIEISENDLEQALEKTKLVAQSSH